MFEKSRFDAGITPPKPFPYKKIPEEKNELHSPMVGKSHDIIPFDYSKYREYLTEVQVVRELCSKGKFPIAFMKKHFPKNWGPYPLPDFLWPEFLTNAGITQKKVKACIEAVRMDLPNDLGRFIFLWLRDKGSLKLKDSEQYKHVPFLETFPETEMLMSKYIYEALVKCFEVKYYYGVARPEQMVEEIYGKERMSVVSYPAPIHPSYAAGHSAAAAATAKFFFDHYELSEEDKLKIRLGAYYFGQFRTMAGVHYAVDNLAGLQIGGLDVGYKKD